MTWDPPPSLPALWGMDAKSARLESCATTRRPVAVAARHTPRTTAVARNLARRPSGAPPPLSGALRTRAALKNPDSGGRSCAMGSPSRLFGDHGEIDHAFVL